MLSVGWPRAGVKKASKDNTADSNTRNENLPFGSIMCRNHVVSNGRNVSLC